MTQERRKKVFNFLGGISSLLVLFFTFIYVSGGQSVSIKKNTEELKELKVDMREFKRDVGGKLDRIETLLYQMKYE